MRFLYGFLKLLVNTFRMILELLFFVIVCVIVTKIFTLNLFPDYPTILNISMFLLFLALLSIPICLICKLVYSVILRVKKKDFELYTILTLAVSISMAYL
jgi:hypothetical protein